MNVETSSTERDIKVALISKLYEKGLLEDAALINEMVVANWSRRADLAVANGHLQAFEIKSDFDSLKRLDGQLSTYISRFEKVTVVCASRFTEEVLRRAHPRVEVLEVIESNEAISFRLVRRGKLHRLQDRQILLGFLLKTEIQNLLKQNSIGFEVDCARHVLEDLATAISPSKIRTFLLTALKQRYSATSADYLSRLRKNRKISANDLTRLRKKKQDRSIKNVEASLTSIEVGSSLNHWVNLDLDDLRDKYGNLPTGMPGSVLRRVRQNAAKS
ncbi:sce7726 family protein [Burkholderia ubonensis]|uniref:sce7726 family protein n=1 Tax=Burkholderia ubonensis TaxID=101571 RepID=UPI0009B3044F|nr:sce7726 family protein [Burkholderia ubonensis]